MSDLIGYRQPADPRANHVRSTSLNSERTIDRRDMTRGGWRGICWTAISNPPVILLTTAINVRGQTGFASNVVGNPMPM